MNNKEAMERISNGEENIYQHKCQTCGELFLEKGKFAFECDECISKHPKWMKFKKIKEYKCYIQSGKLLVGMRVGNFYYGTAHHVGSSTFFMSEYLPWGQTIDGYTYGKKPSRIPKLLFVVIYNIKLAVDRLKGEII